jgi:tetratricopeptide (TPR) repeat protein
MKKENANMKDNLKIVVYAIAQNESQFVDRWMDSMKEADAVVVLDTGSRDDTVAKLKKRGALVEVKTYAGWRNVAEYNRIVKEGKATPWRFDWARNDSIDLANRLVPDADILVCTDLDEILLPGWRAKLEAAWLNYEARNAEKPTTAQYEYVWNFNADGSDGTTYWYEKIHAPHSAKWTHPVHEILEYEGEKRMVRVDGMRLEHHADPHKSRSQYLHMLELSVAEAPNDDRNAHYLAREYMFRGRWEDAIKGFKRHLSLPTATWRAERAASLRYIARCYGELGDAARQEAYLWRAINEEPAQREAALELAELANSQKDWPLLVRACERCLAVTKRTLSYLTKAEAWGYRPHDLFSIGLWYTGRRQEALKANAEAMRLNPNDKRLKDNDAVMRKIIAESEEGGDGR